jgi:hypothetical protein
LPNPTLYCFVSKRFLNERHIKLSPGTHGPEPGRLAILFSVVEVLPLVPFGDEHFNGLTEKLVPPVTKQSFGLGIDQGDLAMLIGNDHGIRGRFQKRLKFIMRPRLPSGATQTSGATPIYHSSGSKP